MHNTWNRVAFLQCEQAAQHSLAQISLNQNLVTMYSDSSYYCECSLTPANQKQLNMRNQYKICIGDSNVHKSASLPAQVKEMLECLILVRCLRACICMCLHQAVPNSLAETSSI